MIDRTLPDIPAEWFSRPHAATGIHGTSHTRRVWLHAQQIAELLGLWPWQCEALDYAAQWHDIGRRNDGVDDCHGALSAQRVLSLGLHRHLEPRVAAAALHAVAHHSMPDEVGESAGLRLDEPDYALEVFRVLKDADALDRVRIGSLDPSYLRFEVSARRVDLAWRLYDTL